MTETEKAIIQWARRFAPDITLDDLSVSLHVPYSAVRAEAKDVKPEVESKVKTWRRACGALAELAYEHSPLTREEIAEIAGVTRQHLVTCIQEAGRNG